MDDLTPIQSFYTGKNVFITGATGFLGKLLVEKLLRSCSTVGTIYILIRGKKGRTIEERKQQMFEDVVFHLMTEKNPDFHKKIVIIPGDLMEAELGISQEDRKTLIQNVNIVFHVAATVNFNETLAIAARLNVRSVKDMINLAKEMTNLESFVHVSTLYAPCIHPYVEERFYKPPIDYRKLLVMSDNLDDATMNKIEPLVLNEYPNTYSFTKAVSEDLIYQEAKNLPVAVFRPAIVISTYKEPLKGWIDNLYGPTGVTAAASNGLLRCLNTDKNANANLVPADMTVNALVSVAWETSKKKREEDVIAYYCTKEWTVSSCRIQQMCNNMDEKDKEIFYCDLKKLDWDDYFLEYLKGLRIYLIKDPLSTLKRAQKRFRRFFWLHQIVKFSLLCGFAKIVWLILSFVSFK